MNTVIVNYKTYEKSSGRNALILTKELEKNSKGVDLIVATGNIDVYMIAKETKTKVLAQHMDNIDFGAHTGKTLGKSISDSKAFGVLMNHAEDRLAFSDIKDNVKRCKKLGLKTVICCADLDEARQVIKLKPDYIAFEVPELIGTGKSISKFAPDSVKEFVKIVGKNSIPLCGAGVSTNEDYKAAIKLGTKGVLLASAITEAKNPGKVMKDLIK